MSTLPDLLHRAVLVIDMQVGVVAHAYERAAVVANILHVIGQARNARVPVIWIQHASEDLVPGTSVWQIVSELVPNPDELVLEKHFGDAFEDTRLASVLASLKVGHLTIVGAQTDACIRSTLHGAFVRGYDVTLVKDAHTTDDLTAWGAPAPKDVIAHTNLYWGFQSAPGRTANVVEASALAFS